MMNIESRQIMLNGVEFTYLSAGTGPLMVLLHGFPDTPHSFEAQIAAFSRDGYQVVAPFMRGYAPTGLSPDGQYHTSQLGADVIALIKALGHAKAVVVGHDYGAAAAYAAAFTAPACIEALVTVSVPHGPELATAIFVDPEQQRRSWYIYFFQLPFAEAAVQFNGHAFIDRLWKDWSPGMQPRPDLLAAVKKSFAQPGALSAALGYYRTAMAGPPADAALAAVQQQMAGAPIGVPCLNVHGADDGCIGVGVTQDMHKHFTGRFERVVIDQAGHFVHVEQPQIFNATLKKFLAAAQR
jgi:pimeloyl-ACP methyl ester carboxylesterase